MLDQINYLYICSLVQIVHLANVKPFFKVIYLISNTIFLKTEAFYVKNTHWCQTKVETTGATSRLQDFDFKTFRDSRLFQTSRPKNKWCHGTSGTTQFGAIGYDIHWEPSPQQLAICFQNSCKNCFLIKTFLYENT